jgi:hypothetical protein
VVVAVVLAALGVLAGSEACGPGAPPNVGSGDDGGPPEGGGTDAPVDVEVDGPVLDLDAANAGGDDAAADGGACNLVANLAPAVTSHCRVGVPAFAGGALVAGRYFLVDVAAIGPTQLYCTSVFVQTGFRETARLVVSAAGVGTYETAVQLATGGIRHMTLTLAPAAGGASPAHVTLLCPATPPGADTPYTSALGATGKQELSYVFKYGTGSAVYRWERQGP